MCVCMVAVVFTADLLTERIRHECTKNAKTPPHFKTVDRQTLKEKKRNENKIDMMHETKHVDTTVVSRASRK